MRPKLMRMIAALAAAVLLVTWPVPASPPAQSPRGPGENYSAIPSARASTFLAEIRNETAELLADIQRETAELSPHPYTSRNLPWGPQSDWQKRDPFLDRAKGHMNAVGERIKKLQHIRAFVLPWQQLAITEVTSHAAQVAASIQAVRPGMEVFKVSAKSGEGMEDFTKFVSARLTQMRAVPAV